MAVGSGDGGPEPTMIGIIAVYFLGLFVMLYILGKDAFKRLFYSLTGSGTKPEEETIEEHFYGNRKFHWACLTLSTIASIFSGFTIVGMPKKMYGNGWDVLKWFANSAPIPLTMMVIAPRLGRLGRAKKYITPIDFLVDRFGQGTDPLNQFSVKVIRVLGIIMYIIPITIYLTGQYIAFNTNVFAVLHMENSEMNQAVMGFIFAILLVIFEVFGGFRAVIWSDTIQGGVLIVALIICTLYIFIQADFGGITAGTAAMYDMRRAILDSRDPALMKKISSSVFDQKASSAMATGATQETLYKGGSDKAPSWIDFAFVAGIGRVCSADVISRIMASSSQAKLRKTTSILMIANMGVKLAVLFIGLQVHRIARRDTSSLAAPDTFPEFCSEINKQDDIFSKLLGGILYSASLAAIMSTADSMLIEVVKFITFEIVKPTLNGVKFIANCVPRKNFNKAGKLTEQGIMGAATVLTFVMAFVAYTLSSVPVIPDTKADPTAEGGKKEIYRAVFTNQRLTKLFKTQNLFMNALMPAFVIGIYNDRVPPWVAMVSMVLGSWIGFYELFFEMTAPSETVPYKAALKEKFFYSMPAPGMITILANLTFVTLFAVLGKGKKWTDREPSTTTHVTLTLEGDDGLAKKVTLGIWGAKVDGEKVVGRACKNLKQVTVGETTVSMGSIGNQESAKGGGFTDCNHRPGMVYIWDNQLVVSRDGILPAGDCHVIGRVVEGYDALENTQTGDSFDLLCAPVMDLLLMQPLGNGVEGGETGEVHVKDVSQQPGDVDPTSGTGRYIFMTIIALVVIGMPWTFWEVDNDSLSNCKDGMWVLVNKAGSVVEAGTKGSQMRCWDATNKVTGWQLSWLGLPHWVTSYLARILVVVTMTTYLALYHWHSYDPKAINLDEDDDLDSKPPVKPKKSWTHYAGTIVLWGITAGAIVIVYMEQTTDAATATLPSYMFRGPNFSLILGGAAIAAIAWVMAYLKTSKGRIQVGSQDFEIELLGAR